MSGRGYFIVLEGIDGSGSTTQAHRLVAHFTALGYTARFTCEPSSGHVGKLLRAALEKRLPATTGAEAHRFDWGTLALLFAADRLDHLASEVEPALARGEIVVSDRYTLSSFVYQSLTAPSVQSGQGAAAPRADDALLWLRALNQRAREPDLCLVLDVPAHEAAGRRERRGGAQELFDDLELQQRLAAGYARGAELAPTQPQTVVDGVGAPEAVTERLIAAVLACFPELGVRR